MRIGIDISLLCIPQTGIGQYRYNLIKSLLELQSGDEFCLYGYNYRWNHLFDGMEFPNPDSYTIDVKKLPNRGISLWWSFFGKPLLEETVKECDLYHISETSFQPSRKPSVATVHDLTIEKFPELHLKENRFFANRRHQAIARSGMPIIAVSQNSKMDFVDHYGVNPERIRVIYHGKDPMYRPIEDKKKIKKVLNKYGISEPYFLYMGTLEPRKNVPLLIEAFHELKEQEKIPHKLVLAGKEGWHFNEIFQKITEKKLETDVIQTGFVPESDKPYLLNGAEIFVYPSLYEGFGLPVLEAMACGVPVVTSNVSSLPEVAGEDGALLIDPGNKSEFIGAIWWILRDEKTALRLKEAGLRQAEKFSWEKCARETMDFYREISR